MALDCVIVPTVSCCLRQPRIAFEATQSFSKISRTALAAVFCEVGKYEADLGWVIYDEYRSHLLDPAFDHSVVRDFHLRGVGTSFIMLCETCMGTLIPALSGKPNSGTRPSDFAGHL